MAVLGGHDCCKRVDRWVSLFGFACRKRRFGHGFLGGVSSLSGGSVVVSVLIVGGVSVGGGMSHVVGLCRSRKRLGGQNRLGGGGGGGVFWFCVVEFFVVTLGSSGGGGPNGMGVLNGTRGSCCSGGFAYPSFLIK